MIDTGGDKLAEKQSKRIPRQLYKYIEFELYNYDKTKEDVAELRGDVFVGTSPQSDLGTTIKSGQTSDTTGKKAERLLTNKGIVQGSRTVNAIDRALRRLSDNHKAVFELKYRQSFSWQRVCEEIPVAESTYFQLRRELIILVGMEMGVIRESS